MNRIKIAKTVSTLTQPPIITIPLFLIITIVLSFNNGIFDADTFILLEIIALIFASVLPTVIIVYWAKKAGGDIDISNRTDRFTPLIVGIISYFIGFLISLSLNLNNFLTILLLCYSVNTGVVLLITLKWKISVHTTGLSGPVAALILLLGPIGALFGIIYPVLIWSRVLLKKHTLSQAICGGVQGFFLTVLEMYLFSDILNLPVESMVSLEMSVFYILAIIATPVVLGILSYTNLKINFYILEIILAVLFVLLMPFEVFGVFVLVSLASVLISYFAGDEFIWFKIVKSS